ncbi:MAG TPA: hypothetical protein VGF89_13405 [Steroidobacteraceae bacterium]|jgi:hypothetical protein
MAAQPRSRRPRAWLLALLAGAALALLCWGTWAALAPIRSASPDRLFEIPKGTWARRMAGSKVEILPAKIRLTLGIHDVLVLKNLDDVPQVFGAILLMPGQSFRLPFAMAASYQFSCTAHLSGQMTIVVLPHPDSAWARLTWRAAALWRAA